MKISFYTSFIWLVTLTVMFNLTRWSRVLRDTAASQLNDISRSAGAFAVARLRDWALVRATVMCN